MAGGKIFDILRKILTKIIIFLIRFCSDLKKSITGLDAFYGYDCNLR